MSTVTGIEKYCSEYKYVVVHADKLIHTPDVIKTTGTHAAIYSVFYAIFLFCKVEFKVNPFSCNNPLSHQF